MQPIVHATKDTTKDTTTRSTGAGKDEEARLRTLLVPFLYNSPLLLLKLPVMQASGRMGEATHTHTSGRMEEPTHTQLNSAPASCYARRLVMRAAFVWTWWLNFWPKP